jgi:hypothetical protein
LGISAVPRKFLSLPDTSKGAPYKYIVAQDSTPFVQAPDVIIRALKRLTWAGKETLDDKHEEFWEFNEMLSVGYFEKSHMSVSIELICSKGGPLTTTVP